MKEQHEQLDSKKIIRAISPGGRAFLTKLDIFESLDSTNTYLLQQAVPPLKPQSGWVCLAEQQTQGRGRQGKEWFSPYARNIYCSLAWSFPPFFQGLSALSLVCGSVLIQALNSLDVKEGLGLKWPNDVLFSRRKLSGILLENRRSSQQNWVVIGLGLNLCLPEDKSNAWIGLEEILGQRLSRNLVTGVVLDYLLRGVSLFTAHGVKPFLPFIREHDLLLEKEVLIYTPTETKLGLAQGLSEEGDLLLLDENGKLLKFCYGEVSVRLSE